MKTELKIVGILLAVVLIAGLLPSRPVKPDEIGKLGPEIIAKLVSLGVIDSEKADPAELSELNLLWAFGLANKNPVLEKGPMMDMSHGGPEHMASVGGWTLSRGSAMEHYSQYELVTLTSSQQTLLEKVAKKVYRPCCSNSTYFPDCNHGMAMLGMLELMVANGASEQIMLEKANEKNSEWFPGWGGSSCAV